MRAIFLLLFLSIKVVMAGEGWTQLVCDGNAMCTASTTVSSLSINPRSFQGIRNYLVQSHISISGFIPAFQIGFQNESLQINRTAIPSVDPEGFGLTNIYEKNQEVNGGFSDLSALTPGSDNWVRSVVALQEGQTTNYFGKNYQTSSETLEYVCKGMDGYNTFFQGVSPLVFRSSKATDSLNPIFALMIQPFDPSDSEEDLSDSVFLSGGAFVSGVLDFNESRGVRGNEPGNAFCLLACDQLILTVKGSGIS